MLYLSLSIAIRFKKIIACTLMSWLLSAYDNKNDLLIQGDVEGEFMYIAAPASGMLKNLYVKKGDRIQSDALLFALDNERETQRYLQVQHQLDIEQSTLVDLQSGRRKTELDVLRAQLNGAIIATRLAHSKLARNEKQAKCGAISEFELEAYRSDYNQKAAVVEELQNRLSADELPSRDAQQRAQTARIEAAKSVLNQSKWALDQMTRASLVNAQVFDTFYQVGEWVPAVGSSGWHSPPACCITRNSCCWKNPPQGLTLTPGRSFGKCCMRYIIPVISLLKRNWPRSNRRQRRWHREKYSLLLISPLTLVINYCAVKKPVC